MRNGENTRSLDGKWGLESFFISVSMLRFAHAALARITAEQESHFAPPNQRVTLLNFKSLSVSVNFLNDLLQLSFSGGVAHLAGSGCVMPATAIFEHQLANIRCTATIKN